MHHYGVFRRLLGCGAGEDEAMTRWGEIKCPRCEEREAKLAQQDDLVKRMNDARDFPANTCGASRHAAMIAEALCSGDDYPMLAEEPDHCGGSIAATVAALWECRTKLAQQDDLVQAAVAAALREAAEAVEDYCADAPDLAWHGHSVGIRDAILALIREGGE
jgi:hypothetical protein